MAFFPQLSTGAIAQLPYGRKRLRRTIMSEKRGWAQVKMADPQAAFVEWNLPFVHLNEEETTTLLRLHGSSEGCLKSFVFLDPAANLLKWSEDFARLEWTKDPLLQLTGGIPDPYGRPRATLVTNTAVVPQWLEQTIEAPANYTFCFSMYLRAAQAGTARLRRRSAGEEQFTTVPVNPEWRRVSCLGNLTAAQPPVRFGLEVPPAAAIEIFGAQVDAQLEPAAYRRTAAQSGVYTEARFGDGGFVFTMEGPGRWGLELRVVAREEL
jgi:hypothetical protein